MQEQLPRHEEHEVSYFSFVFFVPSWCIKNKVYFSKPIKSQTLCEKVESLCSGTGGPFG